MIYVTATLVLGGLFTALAFLLQLAGRYLVNFKPCTVSLSDGSQRFTVDGGGNLLTALLDHQIKIPAACGGKGMCGYCKVRVLKGGGALLPTERPFLSRRDIATGIRLACQVKVREDVEVAVPDFLDVVSEIVRNGTYDKKAKWRFSIQGEEHETV